MTSQLNVDTIVDKAGSGGTNVKVGNTSTYVSDSGAATQNIVNSLVKQWVYLDHANATLKSSLNTSSLTDTNNGRGDFNLTTAFSSVNDYGANYTGNAYNGNSWNTNTANTKMNWNTTNTTLKYDFASYSDGIGAYVDSLYAYSLSFGDLA